MGRAAAVTARGRRRRRWTLAGSGLLLAASAAVLVVQPLWAFGLLARATPGIVWRASTSEHAVALTFDDGPAPAHTPRVLEILARHRARATFFLIGQHAAAHPALVERIRAEGHEIGNHAFSIHSVMRHDRAAFLANLARTDAALGLRGPVKLFRPPGGKIRPWQLRLAREQGYEVVLGSAYPYDPAHPPPAYIRWLVAKNLAPGVIVILHDGIPDPAQTIAALDGILAEGRQRGFRFVTVGELLGGKKPQPSSSSSRWMPPVTSAAPSPTYMSISL
ncbi:MAG TPA: polysaccharide deacetylase family protein, partial [Vicinamibacteria bacterium]|nr:polysaccharide deacetylase family protein [Vicinamibacteria bacterium]